MTPIEWIMEAGCAATGATRAEMRGRSRKPLLVAKRAWIASKMRLEGYSYPVIGRELRRHHATVMWILGATGRKKVRR